MTTNNETRETANNAADAVSSVANRMEATVDRGTDAAGDIAQKASGAIRDYTSRADDTAATVAQKMDSASDYLHDAKVETLGSDIRTYIKDHPTQAVIAALVVGFLLAKVVSR